MKLSLKEILFIFFNVTKDVISNAFMPLLITLIKTSMIAFVLYCMFHYAGHNIEYIRNLNFVSCLVMVVSVRLLLFKYDDFDDDNEGFNEPDASIPQYLQDDQGSVTPAIEDDKEQELLQEQVVIPPANVRKNVEANESTRE